MNSPIAMRDAYGWKFAFFHPPIHGFQFRQRKTVNMSSTQPNIFHVKGRKILRKWQKKLDIIHLYKYIVSCYTLQD